MAEGDPVDIEGNPLGVKHAGDYVDLGTLPPDHPWRNCALAKHGGQLRRRGLDKKWHAIAPTWAIARSTYNAVEAAWARGGAAYQEFILTNPPLLAKEEANG